CKLYKDGGATGTLCEPLCSKKDIQSITCHTFGTTKEAVFSAEWHGTRLVFKSVSINVKSLHWFDNGILKYPTEKELLSTVRAVVKNKLNITLAYDSAVRLTRLRPSYEEKDIVKRQKEIDNIWILVQDNEYLLSAIYTDKDIFPQLLGTCGPYFAVEYMEPIREISSLLTFSDSREDWAKRLKISVQILELLEELETGFREPFHLCDIKLEHFGFVKGGNKLKFVDLDGVYPKSIIKKIITNTYNCEKDEDCDFYDCRSKCIKQSGKCANFVGWRLSNTVIVPGLLMSQHTPSELASILRQCANPEGEEGKPRAAPESDIKKRLVNVLSEIEQSVNDDIFL
ncbi:PIP49 C domain containing protein, partial [Asbolus verrucosus]